MREEEARERQAFIDKKLAIAAANRQSFEVSGGELDIRDLDFPADQHFGFHHGQFTMWCATRIAKYLDIQEANTLEAIKYAALLHDVGRRGTWREKDNDHARSASMAEAWLFKRQTPTPIIADVCQLIVYHDLGADELPSDRRLQCLWDADSLEAARIEPRTGTGMQVFRQRTARLCTGFAQAQETKKDWMRHRGWT